jgi:hypothetical protein
LPASERKQLTTTSATRSGSSSGCGPRSTASLSKRVSRMRLVSSARSRPRSCARSACASAPSVVSRSSSSQRPTGAPSSHVLSRSAAKCREALKSPLRINISPTLSSCDQSNEIVSTAPASIAMLAAPRLVCT